VLVVALWVVLPFDYQVPVQVPPRGASASTPSLTQGVWLWTRTDYGDGSALQSPNPNAYTVTFMEGGQLAIRADCNTGSGTYTATGSALTIQLGPMTLAACPPGSQDTAFVRDLSQVASYVFDGPRLVLNMRLDSGNMVFDPQSPTALVGPTWIVTGVNNGRQAVVSTLAGTRLTIAFGADGRVSGDTGCNVFSGSYTLSGSSIAFGPIATTRRACASDEANQQEQEFLAALAASTMYELVGDRLTLRDANGATQISAIGPTVD